VLHLLLSSNCGSIAWIGASAAHGKGLLYTNRATARDGFALRCRFRKELLKVFQQVCRRLEESSNLGIDVLNGLRLALICLQDFKKLLVNIGLSSEAIL
jgi:hypothetical protein